MFNRTNLFKLQQKNPINIHQDTALKLLFIYLRRPIKFIMYIQASHIYMKG